VGGQKGQPLNRRDFIKSLGACAVAPMAVVAAVKVAHDIEKAEYRKEIARRAKETMAYLDAGWTVRGGYAESPTGLALIPLDEDVGVEWKS